MYKLQEMNEDYLLAISKSFNNRKDLFVLFIGEDMLQTISNKFVWGTEKAALLALINHIHQVTKLGLRFPQVHYYVDFERFEGHTPTLV